MLTRIFNVLDAIVDSQLISGSITASNGPTATVESLTSLIGVGSWDFLVNNFIGTMSGGFASVQGTGGTTKIEQELIIDYAKVLTGLPEFARIKKMVINTPYSINVDIETDANFSAIALTASGSITTIVNGISNNISPGITTGNTPTPGQPPDGTDLLVVGAATAGSAEADHIVFDFTSGDDYYSRSTFINTFDSILFRNNILINSIVNNTGGATQVSCIYSSSLSNLWTITVSYENDWFLNPKVKDAVNPDETVFYLTASDVDLSEVTDLFAYPESGGGFPGGTSVEIDWVLDESNPSAPFIYFILPGSISEVDDVEIVATGTQFSGQTLVGLVYAELVDGSGLYRLVPNQTFDRYYDRNVSPVTTIDLKIPDPFGRTGFF